MKIRKLIDGKWFYSFDGKNFQEDPDQTVEGKESPAAPEEETPKEEGTEKTEGEAGEGEKGISDADIEKAAKVVAKQLAEYQDVRDAHQKKMAKVNGGANVKLVDPEVKLLTNRKGVPVKLRQSSVDMTAAWFKNFVGWKVNGNPDSYKSMRELEDKLDAQAKELGVHVKLNAQDSATAADGGVLVPTILHNAIIPLIEDAAVIRPNATVLDMTNIKTLDIPRVMGKPVMTINGEALQKGTSSMSFDKLTLTPYNLAAIVVLTNDLVDYAAFDAVRLLAQAFAEATAKAEDKLFMTGTGSSQPSGIDSYTFSKTIDAGANINFTHINRAYLGIPQYYRSRGVWIMDNETMIALANMKDSNNRPILDMGTLNEAGFPMLKNRPVYEQNDINNKLFFGDLSAYWIGASRQLRIDIAKEATIRGYGLWERNMFAVRAEEKIDGEVADPRAFAEVNNT